MPVDTDVLVVGAGPTGLMLANQLGRRGVRTLIIDRHAGPVVETRELGVDESVVIPQGVAHGFLALEPLELLYLVTNWYDGTDELGFAWDDPAVGVPWPQVQATTDGRPIVSERDATNPALIDLVDRLREAH